MNRLIITRSLAILSVILVLGLGSSQAVAVNVFPAECGNSKTAFGKTEICKNIKDSSGNNPIIDALKLTITILSIIIGFVAVIMIIVAGLSFITANGDAQAIARARSSIIYALVGIVIVALAQTLVAFVLNKI